MMVWCSGRLTIVSCMESDAVRETIIQPTPYWKARAGISSQMSSMLPAKFPGGAFRMDTQKKAKDAALLVVPVRMVPDVP